ncbi:MAG TPA: response regulator [Gemmataceae bacterium]|nr:response regulator [Gemmataceae bacterium]
MTHTEDVEAGVQSLPARQPPLIALVIDDHELTADAVAMFLQTHGYEVLAVYGGAEGLAIAQARRPPIIFCDLVMPGIDGYQVAASLRAGGEYQPLLLAMSALVGESNIQRALAVGFNQFLAKPVDAYQLLTIVQRVIQKPKTNGVS